MNAQVQTPTLSDVLNQCAMVARVVCTAVGLSRCDKIVSAEVEGEKHAQSGTASVLVKRMAGADNLIREMITLQKEAASNLAFYGMPWRPGSYLLPTSSLQVWASKHFDIKEKFDKLNEELKIQAPALIATATKNLAGFNVLPPTEKELSEAFSLEQVLEPVPPGKFPGFPPETEDLLRQQYEENIAATYRDATNASLARLIKPLNVVVNAIARYDTKDEREQKTFFKNSVMENVAEVLDVLPSLNLTGDPVLTTLIEEMKLLKNATAEDVKGNPELRAAVKSKAQSVIERLSGLMGPIPTTI